MSAITQLICNKFGGIRERNACFSSDVITAQDLQNIELYYTGINGGIGIRTVKGNISENSELSGQANIIKIFSSTQKTENYFFVYAENGTKGTLYLKKSETNTLQIIKDDLQKTGEANGFDVSQGWSDLFFFTNGKDMLTAEMNVLAEDQITTTNKIKVLDLKDIEGRSVTGIIAAVWNNRLWISNGNILWYSVLADIYDFATHESGIVTSAGYIELLKNITAIHEYLGALAVFFADSSLLVSVSNGDFSVGDESPGGCAGFNSLVFHDTNLFFYDDTKKSVFSFQQIINGEKTLGENVAVEIQSILNTINSSKLNEIQTYSLFMEGRNEIWWILPSDTNYSTIMIYDYLKGEWIKRKSQKINSVCLVDGELYSAGNDGSILKEYNSDSFNGEYIQHYYNCSPCNLGSDNTLKILVFPPRVSFDMPYNNQFYVKYVKNYNIFKSPKIRFIKSKLKNYLYWGIGFWGKNFWANKHTSAISKFPSATFKTLEISLFTSNASQSFSIKNIEFSKIKVKQV